LPFDVQDYSQDHLQDYEQSMNIARFAQRFARFTLRGPLAVDLAAKAMEHNRRFYVDSASRVT